MMDDMTDLAALTGADSVTVEWRGYFGNDEERYQVRLGKRNDAVQYGWHLWQGVGPTVLAAAIAAIKEMEASNG